MADEINTKINVGINNSVDADAVEKRNQLFNECQHFMTNDVDRADRENLMTISVNTIPDHVNFHDWIVFIYCLSKINVEQMKKENQSSKYSRDVKSDNNNNKLNNNSSVSSKRKRTYVAPVTTKEDTAEALNCIIDGHPLKRPCTKG